MLFPLWKTLFPAYYKAGSFSPIGLSIERSSQPSLSQRLDSALLVSLVSLSLFVVFEFVIIYLFVCVLGAMSLPR